MSYTQNDYIRDLYIREHSSGAIRTDADVRCHHYEKGRADKIELYFPQYADMPDMDDWLQNARVIECFNCVSFKPEYVSRAYHNALIKGGEKEEVLLRIRHTCKQIISTDRLLTDASQIVV